MEECQFKPAFVRVKTHTDKFNDDSRGYEFDIKEMLCTLGHSCIYTNTYIHTNI